MSIMKITMLINVKMSTIVGILTFISMINSTSDSLEARSFHVSSILVLRAVQISFFSVLFLLFSIILLHFTSETKAFSEGYPAIHTVHS